MNKGNNRTTLWIVLGTLVLATAFIVYLASSNSTPAPNGDNSTDSSEVGSNEWIKGDPNAAFTLLEYSDFQCPACQTREPMLADLLDEFGSRIKFVYRNYPLRGIHANAQIASQAAEAAGVQGKFWEMHEMLFAKQDEWSNLSNDEAKIMFDTYAQAIGLDVTKYDIDFDSDEVKDAIDADVEAAEEAGVYSTPSFFWNGKLITVNTSSYESFRQFIREAIAATP